MVYTTNALRNPVPREAFGRVAALLLEDPLFRAQYAADSAGAAAAHGFSLTVMETDALDALLRSLSVTENPNH